MAKQTNDTHEIQNRQYPSDTACFYMRLFTHCIKLFHIYLIILYIFTDITYVYIYLKKDFLFNTYTSDVPASLDSDTFG